MPAIISKMRRAGARAMFSTVATILLVSAPACPASPQSGGLLGGAGQVAVGKPAPALLARTFSGEKIELAALRGRVVVLNFWASWCGPCRSEMPALDALYHEYRDRGVVVIGLSADDPHDRKDALNAAGVVGYLTGMLSEASTNGFGAPQMLPMTYVIGAGGSLDSILRANRGALSAAQLRAVVEAELQKNAGR